MNGKHVIIAGTNKAGTTSFFEYLAAHPSVCPAFIKQTFFFLNKEWQKKLQLTSLYDYDKGIDQYNLFFRNYMEEQLKLEASPEYLYAPGTAEKIFNFIENEGGKIVFILRNPVSRFISLFHFGKQQGIIDRKCSFYDFLQKSSVYTGNTNSSLMADAKTFMKNVCDDLQIDKTFYDNFKFTTHNKTITVKNRFLSDVYKQVREFLIQHTFKSKMGYTTSMLLKKRKYLMQIYNYFSKHINKKIKN